MARRGYPPEFRRRVMDLVKGGRKVSEIASELGVSEQPIYVWRRQARIAAAVTSSENAEPWLRRSESASWELNSRSIAEPLIC
jgi:transposase-like protein